jgi:hypothetical protein
LHAAVHAPLVHEGVLCTVEHATPPEPAQPPQLFTSVWPLTSQPSLTLLSQSKKFVVHVPIEHVPDEHTGVLLFTGQEPLEQLAWQIVCAVPPVKHVVDVVPVVLEGHAQPLVPPGCCTTPPVVPPLSNPKLMLPDE